MLPRRVARLLALIGGGLLAGCAAHVDHPVPIALLIDGDRAAVGKLPDSIDGLALREVALPPPSAVQGDDAAATAGVTRARAAYVRGALDVCRHELEGVDVTTVLAAGQRVLAARALAFDAACAWAANTTSDARADAARFASYGLDMPDAAIAPDVETVLGEAITKLGRAPRAPLAITGVVGARLVVDGKPAGCTLPCQLDLPPGEHVVSVEADGYVPAVRRVQLPDVARVELLQPPALALLAAQQWRARLGRGLPAADAIGASLIARFGGDRRVAYLHGDAHLVGALVVDGKIVATTERARGETANLVRELAYDGQVLQRPAVWQRPWFWITVSAVVVAAAGGIVAVTYQPTIVNHVGIR